ncbi:MAG: addiction module protein [Planctomycetota bacterium]|jgi:putative addiction module component (TIGR02574 family)
MGEDAAKLLQAALKLSPEVRAALAGSLLDSLDESVDEKVEEAWSAELAERVRELDEGSVTTLSWAEARRRIVGDG